MGNVCNLWGEGVASAESLGLTWGVWCFDAVLICLLLGQAGSVWLSAVTRLKA